MKALIEECHISRQTFYYHFEDIYDVMEWSVRRETEQLLHQAAQGGESNDGNCDL